VSVFETLTLSKWKNYTCGSCGSKSNFPAGYMLVVYLVSIGSMTLTKYILGEFSIQIAPIIYFIGALSLMVAIEASTGKLISVRNGT